MIPSPTTIPLDILHPTLKDLFLRCFNDGQSNPSRRPTPQDWVDGLEVALGDLMPCDQVDSHYYSRRYGQCYWCERHQNLGLDIFPGQPGRAPTVARAKPASSPSQPSQKATSPTPPQTTPSKQKSKPKTAPASFSAFPAPSSSPLVRRQSNPITKSPRRNFLVSAGLVGIGIAGGVLLSPGGLLNKLWTREDNQESVSNPSSTPPPDPSPSPPPEGLADFAEYQEALPAGQTLEMVQIPAGSFLMGSPDTDNWADDDEFPQHQVTVSRFVIGKYPVTQAQYQAVMGKNSSYFKSDSPIAQVLKDNCPVELVSWEEAQEFCLKLSEMTGRECRLPSEAEWEYACRAGTTTRYYFGDDANQLGDYAWYSDNSDSQTHPVGEKKPNDWGLYDMHGNVWEWFEDRWHRNYKGAPKDGSAWVQGDNSSRVLRGGG